MMRALAIGLLLIVAGCGDDTMVTSDLAMTCCGPGCACGGRVSCADHDAGWYCTCGPNQTFECTDLPRPHDMARSYTD